MKYMLYYIIEGHYIILMRPIRQRKAGAVSGMGSTEMWKTAQAWEDDIWERCLWNRGMYLQAPRGVRVDQGNLSVPKEDTHETSELSWSVKH